MMTRTLTHERRWAFDYQPQDWISEGNCTGQMTEAFFIAVGDDGRAAKRICRGCPVTKQCLAYAMSTETDSFRYGIWAGLSPGQRRALWKNTPAQERVERWGAKSSRRTSVA